MNVLAGILIGIANEGWFARLVVPFIWGLIWVLRTRLFDKQRLENYVSNVRARGGYQKFGLSPTAGFYLIEYLTAATTSLPIALITGLIRDLFFK